jgi:hypothetical protein
MDRWQQFVIDDLNLQFENATPPRPLWLSCGFGLKLQITNCQITNFPTSSDRI